MSTVSILDYGVGNLGSVRNMYRRLGIDTTIAVTADDIARSERLLLPGVGAFDRGSAALSSAGLFSAIQDLSLTGAPILGICLGMQLLLDGSDEGTQPGLGIVPGFARRFPQHDALRIPHMGWNTVSPSSNSQLFEGLTEENRFYFVHSYYAAPQRPENVLGYTQYGERFASAIQQGNTYGAQFHPEKSHAFGMRLLKNFASL